MSVEFVMEPAPVILIVGFLGSGKTTFLRDLLPKLEAEGLEPSVIINDYANASVDALALEKEGRAVTPISGSCICCGSMQEFIDSLLGIPLTDRRVALIEANGSVDPQILLENLLVIPELKRRFFPILEVGVVDLERWQRREEHNQLERLQLQTASHVLFTHGDTVDRRRLVEVRESIDWLNPNARWVHPQSFVKEVKSLTSEFRDASLESLERSPRERPPVVDPERRHISHAYVGMSVDLPEMVAEQALRSWLRGLPNDVLRVKGVARLAGDRERWVHFQRVGGLRGEAALRDLERKPSVPACAVLIGVQLDGATIRQNLEELINRTDANAA